MAMMSGEQFMLEINFSHLRGRVRQQIGWTLSPEEVRFRLYFRHISRLTNVDSVRLVLIEQAKKVVVAVNDYEERRDGYETTVRANKTLHIGLFFDKAICRIEIGKLFREANKKYLELVDACRAANYFKGDAIPGDPLDPRLFGPMKLHAELVDAARIIGHGPLEDDADDDQ